MRSPLFIGNLQKSLWVFVLPRHLMMAGILWIWLQKHWIDIDNHYHLLRYEYVFSFRCSNYCMELISSLHENYLKLYEIFFLVTLSHFKLFGINLNFKSAEIISNWIEIILICLKIITNCFKLFLSRLKIISNCMKSISS